MDNLYIIMPSYNEEKNISKVIEDWHPLVEKIGNNSRLVIINDGSKDGTYNIINNLKKNHKYLEVLDKPNSGHGSTLLFGYRYAIEKDADYIFQTDSDGQTLSSEFIPFWENRKTYDLVIGYRRGRKDGLSRIVVTNILKIVLFIIFHRLVKDANTPYRLINSKKLYEYLKIIPKDFFLSNVLVSTIFVLRCDKIKWIPITFRPRQGGINSIDFKRIITIGKQALGEFIRFKRNNKNFLYSKYE